MTSFVAKDWKAIATEIQAWIDGNPSLLDGLTTTDLRVGSLETSHVEALAVALEELYYRFSRAIPEAISESCFQAFGFSLLPAQAAAGSVVFSSLTNATSAISIPQGTKLMTKTGVIFTTTVAGTIPLGFKDSAAVPILAVEAGTSGVVAPGAISVVPYSIPGVDSVTNATATMGGSPEETDEARRDRFSRYIRSLPRGTASALEFAALSANTGVIATRTVEPYLLPTPPSGCPYAGLVWVWVDAGEALDAGIRAQIEAAVAEWKAAGIRVEVRDVSRLPIKVKASVLVEDGSRARFQTEIVPLLTQAALQYFSDLKIGDPVSNNALLVKLASVDDAILEMNLKIWAVGSSEPSFISPADISVQVDSDPDSTGVRAVLASGTYQEGVVGVAYPVWGME